MANVLDILDDMDELRNKCKMPRCVIDAIELARWSTFTVYVVGALNFNDQIQKLQGRCSVLEASVNRNVQNISVAQKGSVSRCIS